MKKYLPGLFAVIAAIVLSSFTKPKLGYTYVYQGPFTDLTNELKDPTNWVAEGSSPTFECGSGVDISCSFTTFFDYNEPGENHLSLDAEICLGSGLKIQMIIIYLPIIFDREFANLD